MERIKQRFNVLYELEDVGEINSQIGQMKRELKLFYKEERRKWAPSYARFHREKFKRSFPLQKTS